MITRTNPATAAIQYAIDTNDGMDFLTYWNEGEFDACRHLWPDAPKECYIGADPSLPETLEYLKADPELMAAVLSHAWSISFKYNRDASIRRVVIDVRDTVTMAPDLVASTVARMQEFVSTAKGAL